MSSNTINGLLICTGTSEFKNIGDFIQSVAQEQFFDHIDTYIEREELSSFKSDKAAKCIMNGWFMQNPDKFPPSDSIVPLFISFHITPRIAEKMLSNKKTINYFKAYQPIGVRDYNTKKLLEGKGVESYFTGCLTVCLNKKYKSQIHSDEIIFVDPYYERPQLKKNIKEIFKQICLFLNHPIAGCKLAPKFHNEFPSYIKKISPWLDNAISASIFYHTYSKLFEDEVLYKATYLGHSIPQTKFRNDDDKMEYARSLIKKYAQAKYVITSRIHCALPCLGVETPVLFVSSENLESQNGIRSSGRFDGLIEWLRCLKWTPNGVQIEDEELKRQLSKRKIDSTFIFHNKDTYKSFRDKMFNIISNFIKQ